MARTKIDYGIDLGTTNSAIARIENGKPIIKKSDVSMDTMPSCVNINKKGSIIVGQSAANAHRSETLKALKTLTPITNTFIEFKRTMGADKKYQSSNAGRDYTSEELSAEVLKALKSFVTDDSPKSIVVTVPAKFTINQKDATSVAAKFAGFEHCELLQEPIAASMAYGVATESTDGTWLVFDFGGGTFDAALLKVEEGIMKVIDTEGDNHLGGKNIDLAIVDDILIPHLQSKFAIDSYLSDANKREYFRIALKGFAELNAKIPLSFSTSADVLSDPDDFPLDDNGNEIELDLTLTREDIETVTQPIFQKAIDICKELLSRNGLTGKDLGALILVGGPTWAPQVRQMLRDQVTKNVDTSIDPMTAVAEGAALYASTVNIAEQIVDRDRDRTKIQLDIKFEATTVEVSELVTIKILENKTEGEIPTKVFAEIVRGDKGWSSGKLEINTIGEIFEPLLEPGRSNAFTVVVYDETGNALPSEPTEFTIIQGTKIGSATLPYNLGIAIKSTRKGYPVVRFIDGLQKNQPLPATGVTRGLVTQTAVRSGMSSDVIRIPIYEVEHGTDHSRLINNLHVFDAVITGEDVPKLLPAGSEVELTLKINDSNRILSAYFPLLDHTCTAAFERKNEKEIDADWLEQEISRAMNRVDLLKQDDQSGHGDVLSKLETDLGALEKLLDQGRSDYDRKMQVLQDLRRLNKTIDETEDAVEWPLAEERLKSSFYKLEEVFSAVEGNVESINDDRVRSAITETKNQIEQVIKQKNVQLARELSDRVETMSFSLRDAALGVQMEIGILNDLDEGFDDRNWIDRNKARLLINQGLSMIANNASKKELRPLVRELVWLLPDSDQPIYEGDDTLLTEYES
ncbi:MAG: Hsp70 family protein [Chloracidobacterium sp.]|nr:Hsp70 family protein [Chloracidobacterium sp.]